MQRESRDNSPSSSDSTRETRETGKGREGSPPLRVITLTEGAVPSPNQTLAYKLDRLARSGQPEVMKSQGVPLEKTTTGRERIEDEEDERIAQWAAARQASSSHIAGEGTTEAHPTPRQKPQENFPEHRMTTSFSKDDSDLPHIPPETRKYINYMIERSRHVTQYQQLSKISKGEFDTLIIYCDKYAKQEGLDEKAIAYLRALAINSYNSNNYSETWPIVRSSDIRGYDSIYKNLERRRRQTLEEPFGNEDEINNITFSHINLVKEKYGENIDEEVSGIFGHIDYVIDNKDGKELIDAWRKLEGENDEKTRKIMKAIIKSVREGSESPREDDMV
jgi:hypothetical protein